MRNRQFTSSMFVITLLLGASAWAVHTRAPGEFEAPPPEAAAAGGNGPFPAFTELDVDGDGILSSREAARIERLSRQFNAADVNQDGGLDRSEFSAFEITEGVMPGSEGGAAPDGGMVPPTSEPAR